MDRLSDLPDVLSEKILQCLPLLDAVRTSVLSKKWEYKWTTLPALVLDDLFLHGISLFHRTRSKKEKQNDYLHIVYSILLQHVGTLEEFYLVVPDYTSPKRGYINQLIRTVLTRGVEKLTIHSCAKNRLLWPLSFPPCPRLTHLELNCCEFRRQSSVSVSHHLKSLVLANVRCDPDILSSVISGSPILHRIVLQDLVCEGHLVICAPKLEYLYVRGNFSSIDLQAENAREIQLHMSYIRPYPNWDMANLINFLGSLVKLESLTLSSSMYEVYLNLGLWLKLPRGLSELRILKLGDVEFCDIRKLLFIILLISSSPNLCRLEIYANPPTKRVEGELLNLLPLTLSCEPPCFQHLEKIYVGPIIGSKNELEVIEFLLCCSPALRVLSIRHASNPGKVAKKKFDEALMGFHRASPNVKICIRYQCSGSR